MRLSLTLLLLVLLFIPHGVLAQETGSASADTISTPAQQIEYTLPYPGLLPDSPFYFMKVLRDHVVGFLIKDPLKKAQFNLLQADKRLEAGILLLTEKPEKAQLALETISKSQNYFIDAINSAEQAKKQGMQTIDIGRKLATASRKHEQEIKMLVPSIKGNLKDDMQVLVQRSIALRKEATSLAPN